MNPEVDYYKEVSEFAKQMSLHMSCTNGIFTLSPAPIVHWTDTKNHAEEVAKFKAENPEYRFMKGTKHKEPTEVSYSGDVAGKNSGATAGNTLRHTRLLRRLEHLSSIQNCYCTEVKDLMIHLRKNSYRRLKVHTILVNYLSVTETLNILEELGYTEVTYKGKKEYIKLTPEGKKYVAKFRIPSRKSHKNS